MDDDLEALFLVAPDDFVTARDAIVKRLRADNRKEAAAAFTKLRRPSPVVWAMNQVASTDNHRILALAEMGERALAAQQAVLEGGPIAALHEAVERRRTLISQLVAGALAALTEYGIRTDALAPQLRLAFECASVDAEVGRTLAARRLIALPQPGSDAPPPPSGVQQERALRLVPPIRDDVEASRAERAEAERAQQLRYAHEHVEQSRANLLAARSIHDSAATAVATADREVSTTSQELGTVRARIDAMQREALDLATQLAASALEASALRTAEQRALEQLQHAEHDAERATRDLADLAPGYSPAHGSNDRA